MKKIALIIIPVIIIAAFIIINTVDFSQKEDGTSSPASESSTHQLPADNSTSASEEEEDESTSYMFSENNTSYPDSENNTPETEKTEEITEEETEMLLTETPNIQTGVTVSDTLKIISVGEADGILTVLCENISEKSIKRAVLSVISDGKKLTFSVNDLLHGKKALLFCEEKESFDENAFYTNFTLDNILTFESEPSLREDEFEITLTKNSVAVKNISGKDIESAVYIYYKAKTNNIPNGNETRRMKIQGLKSGALTYINAEGLSPETHEIIFTDYE